MNRLLASFALIILAVAALAGEYTPTQVPDVHRANREDFVANPDGILSAATVAALNRQLAAMRTELTVEPMIVAVDRITDPDNPDQFATDLFGLWGLGKSDLDNGLLILIVYDEHSIVIRPGYGLEGVLPDITCGRIIREIFTPLASSGDIDGAILAATETVGRILSDPTTAEEYRSAQKDADRAGNASDDDPFTIYLLFSCILTGLMLIAFLVKIHSVRGKDDYDKYLALQSWKSVYLILTAAGMFIPLIASVPLILCLNNWRNKPRICPNCSARMGKVDEVHDNDYLTPAQDLEERIGSVDYDVWLCPECGETDILAYVLPSSTYTECEKCHARTARPTGYRVVQRPTQSRKGLAVKTYDCLNCHHHREEKIELPPDQTAAIASAAAAASILGRGGSSGGFGGPIGGGFGGGATGGGGASGRW